MKLLFLGSGSGLVADSKNFQSNMILITDNGKKLLIDCGTDIRFSLARANYVPNDIDAVYISHLHADHIGGLEWFAFQRKFAVQSKLPHLIIHEELVDLLWDHSLSGGLKTLSEKEATIDDFFKVSTLKDDQLFPWGGVNLNLIQTVHVYSNKTLMPSHGLYLHHDNKVFFITTDTQFTPDSFEQYYQEATLIFHDCETRAMPSGVHAHLNQLNTLAPEIKSKIWLYHYNDGKLPDAQSMGFLGFVQRGQVIELK